MPTMRTLPGCFLWILTSVFTPIAFAQSPVISLSEHAGTSNPQPAINSETVIKDRTFLDLGLEPTKNQRFWRSWQYQFQLLEQPAFVVATAADGTTQTIENPNRWLQQHSLKLQFSEWFPRMTNLPDLVKAAYDYQNPDHNNLHRMILDKELCGGGKTMDCLARGDSTWWHLLFSAASVTFSAQQRSKVQQQVILSDLSLSQGWGWNGQVDFDPASLFITSANWKNAMSVFAKYSDGSKRKIALDGSADVTGCFSDAAPHFRLVECENKFAKSRLNPSFHSKWESIAAAVIPSFQLKFLSQFDFIKQGGVLVENPNLQRSLKSFTMTWDLKRLMPSTADRVTIAPLYSPVKSIGNEEPAKATFSQLCIVTSGNMKSYIGVADRSPISSCQQLAVALAVDRYALACASDRTVDIGKPANTADAPLRDNMPATTCGWR